MAVPQTVDDRKGRGDFPTPPFLVELVVAHNLPRVGSGSPVRVLDPACGDGRFLVAAGRALQAVGAEPDLHGIDIDAPSVGAATSALATAGLAGRIEHGDALRRDWGASTYDVVLGNPPYLSQLATATRRGRRSDYGGGPYADTAVEFLALAVRLARPDGGRIALVLPQSVLASRDAGPVRAEVDRLAAMTWSWWSPQRVFDANVYVCALGFTRHAGGSDPMPTDWRRVVTSGLGVPDLPPLATSGSLGDRAALGADFRDQYYGLVPAVVDELDGYGAGPTPPLVTSGLVDPGRCWWGARPVTFARRRIERPRVRLDRLSPRMRRWADAQLVPKVLVANQTRVIEAVADPLGEWLPSVPLLTARPLDPSAVGAIAAVLTSPVASAWAWHRAAGTGLSATSLRLGPRWLAELPWPAGSMEPAAAGLGRGDVVGCGRLVMDAYRLDPSAPAASELLSWWTDRLPRR